jgi:hypothetical protein
MQLELKIANFIFIFFILFSGGIFSQQDSLKQKVNIKSGYLEKKRELPDAII